MEKISTTNVKSNSGFISKSLEPGVKKCKVLEITLDELPYGKERKEYSLTLKLESEAIEGFTGFPTIFGDNNSPKHKGQVGKVKSSRYGLYTGTSPNGYEQNLDSDVLSFLKDLATELGILPYFVALGEFPDIFSLVKRVNQEGAFKDIYINFCLNSRKWINNKGYSQNDLFLPRSGKTGKAFAGDLAKVLAFDSATMVIAPKAKSELKDGFTTEPAKVSAPTGVGKIQPNTSFTDEINQDHKNQQSGLNGLGEKPKDIVTEPDSDLPFDLN